MTERQTTHDQFPNRQELFRIHFLMIQRMAMEAVQAGYRSDQLVVFLIQASTLAMEEVVRALVPSVDIEALKRQGLPIVCGVAGNAIFHLLHVAFPDMDVKTMENMPLMHGEMKVLILNPTGISLCVVQTTSEKKLLQ